MDDAPREAPPQAAARAEVLTPQSLIEALAARGERPAVVTVVGEDAQVWSGAEIAETARRLASGLIAEGIEPGEPVGLYGANRPEWVVARLALGAMGALAAPFDDLLPEAEIAPLISHCGCRRVFTTRAHRDALRGRFGAEEPQWILLDPDESDSRFARSAGRPWQALLAEEPGPLPALDPNAAAMIVTTSGTTGQPKSFRLSHANLSANVQAILALGVIDERDRALLPLPLDNVYPTVVGFLCVLHSGSTLIFPEALTGPQIVKALAVGRASLLIGVPRLYAAVLGGIEGRVAARGRLAGLLFSRLLRLSIGLQRRFGLKPGRRLFGSLHRQIGPDLRLLISGGAKLEPELIWRLEGLGWEVLSGYGLSEVGSVFTANLPWAKKIGSEGRPLHGQGSLRIVLAESEDGERGAGEGEIQLKGPSMLARYDDAEATAGAFTEDGWFRTGDLGRVDDEGYVWVTGRLKEMIVLAGGKNVFPEPLETVYRASPVIEEIAVLELNGALVGLIVPDQEAVRASGYSRTDDLFRVTLADLGRDLPSFQRLSGFALTREPIPRTRLGKYRRFLLPELFEQARAARGATGVAATLSDEDRALLQGWPGNELWALLQARYPDKPLSPDADPQLDLGIDSLEWVSLTLELERRFGVRLSEARIAEVQSLRDLIQAVAEAPELGADESEAGAAERAETGPDPEGWLRPAGPATALLGRGLHGASAAVMRLLFRVRTTGRERIPEDPPCLFIANHVSDLDPLVLAAALPLRQRGALHWGGDRVRLFEKALLRPLARALKVFPVDERAPAASLALAGEALHRGGSLAWFPESWRSPDGELQDFLPGVGHIVAGYQGPIVPTLIEGTFEAMPRNARLPRPHRVTVHFGPPIPARSLVARCGGENAERQIAAALKDAVAALSPP